MPIKRRSTKRRSTKRRSTKRRSTKRRSTKRRSRKRRSVKGGGNRKRRNVKRRRKLGGARGRVLPGWVLARYKLEEKDPTLHKEYVKLDKPDGKCICSRYCNRCPNAATHAGVLCEGCSNEAHGFEDCGCK